MRHRHNGPKVQYRTRRNNIRYRQRPIHSQSLIRRRNRQFRKPVRRMSWDNDDMPVGDEPSLYGEEYIRVKGNRTGPITIGEIERGEAIRRDDIQSIQEDAEDIVREYEEEAKKRRYGIEDIGMMDDSSSSIIKEESGIALIKHHDLASPASEHPDVWEIKDDQGNSLWSSGITYMGEYAYQGLVPDDVSLDIRKEAEEKFREFTK